MKKNVLSAVLAVTLLTTGLSGCGVKKSQTSQSGSDGKIVISIGEWPSENRPAERKEYEKYVEKMKEVRPDVEIVPDEWAYDLQTFLPKASSGQLPTMYNCHLTETKKIINAGYSADITDILNELGYTEYLNKQVLSLCEKDGKYYGIPNGYYIQGLNCNVELFKQAGLVDENGVPKFPQTWDEVAETASIIKQKTGKAGLVFPTINNYGGWHFMNIAWSYGVEFMKQEGDKWIATFDTPECVAALQYVKDLKWKWDALPDNALIDQPEMQKLFATRQGAMYISSGPDNSLTDTYGMAVTDYSGTQIPEGPKGRFAQMGGKTHMFSPSATPEQIQACFDWLKIAEKFEPALTEEQQTAYVDQMREGIRNRKEQGYVITGASSGIWEIPELNEKLKKLGKEEANVKVEMYEGIRNRDGVTIKPEEPMNCQDLYGILDACIQSVLTEKDADPAALIKKANEDFQRNFLDKI